MQHDEIKNISLSYACEKSWNEMKETSGGRFCDSCQHVVHDFTNQSDCYLKKALQENKRVCGRFKRSQLSAHFLKYATATAVVAAGVSINACMEEEINPVIPGAGETTNQIDPAEIPTEIYTVGIISIDPNEQKATQDTTLTNDADEII